MKQKLSLIMIGLLYYSNFNALNAQENNISLSLTQAVHLALQNNYSMRLTLEKEKEAEGKKWQALSSLLPQLSAGVSQFNRTVNLRAQGLSFSALGLPNIVGPFNSFDARLKLAQTLFNLSASHRVDAEKHGVQMIRLEEMLVQDQVAAVTSLSYINALRTDRTVESARADLTLAKDLGKLAHDQHHVGLATGIDVARADTHTADMIVKLSKAKTEHLRARLQLQRVTGLPLDTEVQLTDALPDVESSNPSPALNPAVQKALQQRFEIQIAMEDASRNASLLRSAQTQGIPSIGLSADYGFSGNTINTYALPTRNIGFNVDIPMFNGGLTHGNILQAESQKEQGELTLHDVQIQVEEDVRMAFETLNTTKNEAEAAKQSLILAKREMNLAKDRFAEGVGDNIQVVNAQTTLENAETQNISALADYYIARLNFETALGRAQAFQLH